MSAKQGLLKWLGTFVAFDIVVLGALLAPQLIGTPIVIARVSGALTTILAPPLLLLLNTIVPQSLKHILVFWRFRDVLPAHRAFSICAGTDPRINVFKLKERIGTFPTKPRDQQNTWFGIYQQHKCDAAVVDGHRAFLIFRDLASLSFALAFVVPLLFWAFGFAVAPWSTFAVFGVQFILAATASRQAGKRFVCTVLSVESHSSKPRPRRPTYRGSK